MNKVVRISQKKIVWLASVAFMVMAAPMFAHAQTGCTDSPENPTAVLALVGCAGAFFASARQRLKARGRK